MQGWRAGGGSAGLDKGEARLEAQRPGGLPAPPYTPHTCPQVTLTPSDTIRIDPHPVYDSTEYGSMQELVQRTSTQGLYGGVRLLLVGSTGFAAAA